MKRTKPNLEREVERLRAQHTQLSKENRFVEMQTISRKIRTCLDQLRRRADEGDAQAEKSLDRLGGVGRS